MKDIIIAIDGFSATGKSSTAKEVAKHLEYTYVDTGAMYRAITWKALNNDIDIEKEKKYNFLKSIKIAFHFNKKNGKSEIYLDGKNLEDEIRSLDINHKVSIVSSNIMVREKLVALQKEMGKNKKIVMDGRDIGTVVFPNAELKIFLTSDVDVRAKRRQNELGQMGIFESFEKIKANLEERDYIDQNRENSPLRKADEAILIDTTHLTFDEQVNTIVELAKKIIYGN